MSALASRKAFYGLFVSCMFTFLIWMMIPNVSTAQMTANRIQQSGVLYVGLEGTYPPFNFVDEKGEIQGFDVDIANEIARRLGVKVEFIETLWSSIIQELQEDHFDAIIAQMSITEERKQSVDFTNPYVVTGTVLVARADEDRFSQLSDIAGHKVGVGQGTTFETVARTVDGADVHIFDDFHAYSQALIAGEIDVILEDQLTAAYNIKEQGLPLKITSSPFTEERIAIAVKKGNQDLVDELNRVLNDMIVDGTYRSIFINWFGTEPIL